VAPQIRSGIAMRRAMMVAAAVALIVAMLCVVLNGSPGLQHFFQAMSIGSAAEASDGRVMSGERRRERTPDHLAIERVLATEAAAVSRGDLEQVLELWSDGAVIHDENGTPEDSTDDTQWEGRDGVKERYTRELAARRYRVLRHRALEIKIDGNHAIVVNDLDAVVDEQEHTRTVRLPRCDRWTMIREGGQWRIQQLELNRAARTEHQEPER